MSRLLLLYLFALTGSVASSQEEDPSSPAVVREKVVQWVQTKKLIAEESAKWQTEKQMLSDLIALREREAEQMDEVINLARERVADIEQKSTNLKTEEQERRAWRQDFDKKVTVLETQLIPQIPYFPKPVASRLSSEITRLKDREDNGDLQSRFRDVLAILNETISFNSQIHSLPEMRELEGKNVEVDVIYLGMNQAWYVDRTNTRAGLGIPTKDGWVWTSKPGIARKSTPGG